MGGAPHTRTHLLSRPRRCSAASCPCPGTGRRVLGQLHAALLPTLSTPRPHLGPQRRAQRLGDCFSSLDVLLLGLQAADAGLLALLLVEGDAGAGSQRRAGARHTPRGASCAAPHTLMMMYGRPNSSNMRLMVPRRREARVNRGGALSAQRGARPRTPLVGLQAHAAKPDTRTAGVPVRAPASGCERAEGSRQTAMGPTTRATVRHALLPVRCDWRASDAHVRRVRGAAHQQDSSLASPCLCPAQWSPYDNNGGAWTPMRPWVSCLLCG